MIKGATVAFEGPATARSERQVQRPNRAFRHRLEGDTGAVLVIDAATVIGPRPNGRWLLPDWDDDLAALANLLGRLAERLGRDRGDARD